MRNLKSIMVLAAMLAVAGPAAAQLVNGDFSAGLSGWTIASSGSGLVLGNSYGNPGPSVMLSGEGNDTNVGTASIAQTFLCGDGGVTGSCAIAFDYMCEASLSSVVHFTVELDNIVVFTVDHDVTMAAFTPVAFSAPCGEHTLKFTASNAVAGIFNHWYIGLDNITASCQAAVADEARSWSAVKATYR